MTDTVKMSQHSKISVRSTRSEREKFAKDLFEGLRQDQRERDCIMNTVVSKLADFVAEGSSRGSSHGISNLSDFDGESLASYAASKYTKIKESPSESVIKVYSPNATPLTRMNQIDGNDTAETQSEAPIGGKTPVLSNKATFGTQDFIAPGSSLRREKEISSFSENENEETTSGNKPDLPGPLKSRADISFKSVVGNITRKLGGFRLTTKDNQLRVKQPEKVQEKTLHGEIAQAKPVPQIITVDYSAINIPAIREDDQNKVSGGTGYGETPFRNVSEVQTGKTDPKFKHRLPLTNYEGRDDDYSGAFCNDAKDFTDPMQRFVQSENLENTEGIFTAKHVERQAQPNLTGEDSWTEEDTSKESFRKANNAVTQFKGVISKRCNKIRSELKTLSVPALELRLTDLDDALNIFEQKCQKFMTHEMTEENRTLQIHSFDKYKGDLLNTKGRVTSELQCRWQDLKSLENIPTHKIGATNQAQKKTVSDLEREVLSSVERTHGKPIQELSEQSHSGLTQSTQTKQIRNERNAVHLNIRNKPVETVQSKGHDVSKTVNWATLAKQQGNEIRKKVHKKAEKRRSGNGSDSTDSVTLKAFYEIARSAKWTEEKLKHELNSYESNRGRQVSLEQQRLFRSGRKSDQRRAFSSDSVSMFETNGQSTPNDNRSVPEFSGQKYGTTNLYEHQNFSRGRASVQPNLQMNQTTHTSGGPARGGGPQESFVQPTELHFGVPPPPLPPRDNLNRQQENGPPNPHNPGGPPGRPPDPSYDPNPGDPWSIRTNSPWRPFVDRTPLKLTLKVFNGKNIGDEYVIFREQFMTLCGDRQMPQKQKLCFLLAYLEGQALQTAKQAMGRSLRDDSFLKVMKTLDERFGGEERMKRNYLNDLRTFAPLTKFTADGLWKLYYLLSAIREWMIGENESQIYDKGSFVVLNIKEILPETELGFYLDEIEQLNKSDCLETLYNYIHRKAKAAQAMEESRRRPTLSQNTLLTLSPIQEVSDEKKGSDTDFDLTLATGEKKMQESLTTFEKKPFQTTRDSLQNPSIPTADILPKKNGCPHCDGPHALWKCEDFKMQEMTTRYMIVKNKNLCFHCLSRGHRAKDCTFNKDKKCGIDNCTYYHNRLLHKPKNVALIWIEEYVRDVDSGWEKQETTSELSSARGEVLHTVDQTLVTSSGNYVSVRTTIVEVGKSKGPKKRIVVALDSCANNTNIDEDLAKELDLPIVRQGIQREVTGLLSDNSYQSAQVQLYISPFGSGKKYPILAYTVKNLLSKVPIVDWEKESHRYPYLKKGNPVKMEPGDKFGILLGTDHGELQLSDAKILGQPGEPFGERTELGWAFSGPLKNVQFPNRKLGVIGLSTVTNQVILSTNDNSWHNDLRTDERDTLQPVEYQEVEEDSMSETVSFLREDVLLENITEKNLNDTLLTYLRMKGPHYSKETVLFNDESYIDLGKRVQQLWELEHLGLKELIPRFSNSIKENPMSRWTEAERASDDKLKVIYLPEKKQFQVSIPWINHRPSFTTNRFQVICRQRRCEQHLVTNGVPLEEVQKIFDGYLEKGYIRKLLPEEYFDFDAFYLPWFPVIDRTRDSTPVRLVFDAAAKDKTGRSLNSEIELTPNRLQDLIKIWLRLRKFQWVVTSDVSEMFLKCILDPSDRRYHRFTFNGEDYEWQVTLFGNLSSPNGSQKVLDMNCQMHGKDKPEAVESISNSCYMDDVADTREDEEKAWQLVKELTELLPMCGMPVRKFYTNSPLVLSRINPELLAKQISFNETNDVIYENGKVLGMQYDATENDCLVFVSKFTCMDDLISWKNRGTETKVKDDEWTKRLILRASASIFDPLGLISPFTVQAKVLLQKVWSLKIGWDDPLPDAILKKWMEWLRDVFEISLFKIPRWTGLTSKSKLQLHIFCDASEEGFCVAVYSRVKNAKEIQTTLLASKSRVSPLKTESISRLELIACVLSVRMWSVIRETYPTTPENTFFWTDSEVCLHWINTPAKSFKAFVAHRIGEIQSATEPMQWRHVPTAQNPADVGTRPITVTELKSKDLWWKGPEFLRAHPSFWPKGKVPIEVESKELKQTSLFSVTISSPINIGDEVFRKIHPQNFRVGTVFNGYRTCIRKWAMLFRAIRNFRGTNKSGNGVFRPQELNEARDYLIKQSQEEFYGKEIYEMTKCKTTLANCKKPISDIRQLNPFIDNDGLVRSNSRISKHVEIYGFDKTHPIILHRKSEIARLIVEESHSVDEHTIGISAMKAKVNEKFVTLGLGTLCRQVQSNCYRCRIRKGVRLVQQMAPLPIIKLEEKIKAFENCGMDFAGPFEAKMERRMARKKVYILVITCLATRAVHLETTGGMTTNDVIAALSRFCDIRGTPKTIITDNQTSFHKADKELHEWIASLDWNQLEEETGMAFKPHSYGITWLFNPPYAPHFGGIFETIVKATKRALEATMKRADLTEDEFRTIVYAVMSRLNDRPIAFVGQEKEDLSPLTPNCFLMSHLGYTLLPPNNIEKKMISPKDRWKFMLEIRNHFWKRFSDEIVPLLRTRTKWSHEKENLEVDDIVIEFTQNSPRHAWKMMRVSQVFPSEDGLVRRVEVTNSGGQTYIRPIANLIPVVQN